MQVEGCLNEDTQTARVTCHPLKVTESEARKKVNRTPERFLFYRWRSLQAELVYKPFWVSRVQLVRATWSNRAESIEFLVLIDGLTSIARCKKGKPIEEGKTIVGLEKAYSPKLSEADAERYRDRNLRQVCAKEGYKVTTAQKPKLVYRPVWIIKGGRRSGYHMVDAHTGYVTKSCP